MDDALRTQYHSYYPLDVWLFAATAPSIESSHALRLGCYSYAYEK